MLLTYKHTAYTLLPLCVVKCVPELGRMCVVGCRLLGVYAADCPGPGGHLVVACIAVESQVVTPAAVILPPLAPPALYSDLTHTHTKKRKKRKETHTLLFMLNHLLQP